MSTILDIAALAGLGFGGLIMYNKLYPPVQGASPTPTQLPGNSIETWLPFEWQQEAQNALLAPYSIGDSIQQWWTAVSTSTGLAW